MRRLLLLLLACSSMSVAAARGQDTSGGGIPESISWMSGKSKIDTYKNFCKINILVRPHPDKEIESFILKAYKGDSDSFAFVGFMVWNGYAGFKADKLAGKLALVTAMNHGSPSAAAFIAQTFLKAKTTSSDEQADAVLSAIHWYGVSVGMGSTTAYDLSMKLIDMISKDNNQTKDALFGVLNNGIAEGKQKRKP